METNLSLFRLCEMRNHEHGIFSTKQRIYRKEHSQMKKLFAFCFMVCLLAVGLILTAPKASAATLDSLTYEVRTGCVAITGCNESSTGELIIPSTIEGLPVTHISERAFANCRNLTSVIIPDSVTYIGTYAFAGCNKLTSVIIPDSVTHIQSYAIHS